MDSTTNKFYYQQPSVTNHAEGSHKKKKPCNSKILCSSLKKTGKGFCKDTSLHGLRYVGEEGRPSFERIAWVLIIILFLIFGAFVMQPIYRKWQVVPTITTVETTYYPIWNIYFPAVTICSNNKIVPKQLDKIFYSEYWKNLTLNDTNLKDDLVLALTMTLAYDNEEKTFESENQAERVKLVLESHKDQMAKLIQMVMPSCSNMLLYCEWQGKAVECGDLFGVRNTDNGYCCSFNTLKMSEQFVRTEDLDNSSSTLLDEYEDYDLDAVLAECPYPTYFTDGYCDDVNNIPECLFDGGDCCDEESNRNYCVFCECFNTNNFTGCPYSGLAGDGVCSDVANTLACNFDGGDCCNTSSNYTQCGKCECLTEGDTNCSYPFLIGNGYCNDIVNTPECNFDGGDCCDENASKAYCIDCKCFASSSKASNVNETSTKGKNEPTKLRKTNVANSRLGLTLLLYPDAKSYHSSAENNYIGFKVLVHSPYDFAEVAGKGFTIGANTEAFIAVGAQYTTTSADVQSMPLEKRKCLSHSESLSDHPEIILEAFQNYSRKACLLECQARDIFKTCSCLPYFFADFGKIWKVNTACNMAGLQCLASIADSKRALQPEGMEGVDGYIANALACNCPNDCEETLYFQEMSESFVKKKSEFFRYLKNSPDNIVGRLVEEAKNMTFPQQKKRLYQRIEDIETTGSIVHVYFKELGIVKYSRDQVYSAMDVIAAFGGIIGLCSGFSLISAVEILYWFTIRLFFENKTKEKSNK